MATQGKYAVVDTTLSITDSTPIPGLNGRQGDGGRIVYFALKDGRIPHNLDGQDVTLQVKDAAGKIKVVNGIYDMISATAGLFSMLIPAEVYQAAGDVEEAFLVVTDQQNLVISSIPITFTVFANGIILSANASQDYINRIQKLIDEANQRIETLKNNVGIQNTSIETLQQAIDRMTALVNNNQVAALASDNKFAGTNEFTKTIKATGGITGNLIGNASTSTIANASALPLKQQVAIDLNELPPLNTLQTQYAYYFSSPTSVKNVPDNVTSGLVEYFVLAKYTIIQRFTRITNSGAKVSQRIISNWNDEINPPTYNKWTSTTDMRATSIKAFGGNVNFYRIGNTVTVNAYVEGVNFKVQDFELIYSAGTIPVGYRPTLDYAGIHLETPTWLKDSNRNNGQLQFGQSGWIGARSAYVKDSLASWIMISGTYITNDSMPI